MTSRRGFLVGAFSVLAAPAVVRAESLMQIAVLREGVAAPLIVHPGNQILTISEITREAMRLWKNSRTFIDHVEAQYGLDFV